MSGPSRSFEAVDAQSATIDKAAIQAALDGYVIPIGPGLGVSDAIDPATTGTPVQEAVDAVSNAGGGLVQLPRDTVEEDTTITWASQVSMRGIGCSSVFASDPVSRIEIQDSDNVRGIDIPGGADSFYWRDFHLAGTSAAGSDTDAIGGNTGGLSDIRIDNISIDPWRGNGLHLVKPFQTSIGRIAVRTDAGSADGEIFYEDCGPKNHVQEITSYPNDPASGQDSDIMVVDGGECRIGGMNIGGAPNRALFGKFSFGSLSLDYLNYEPNKSNSQTTYVVHLKTLHVNRTGTIILNDAQNALDVNQVYGLSNPQNAVLGRPAYINGASTQNPRVRVNDDVTGGESIIYAGFADEVNNATGGTMTNPVICLSDVTKKASTGAGYDGGADDSRL